jgi:hypothetical protein
LQVFPRWIELIGKAREMARIEERKRRREKCW